MGSSLSQPVTTKETASGAGERHAWGSSCMQGWRVAMEDAHITISAFEADGTELTGLSVFGVFDGHGGPEVAHFCRQHMPDELKRQLRLCSGAGKTSSTIFGEALTGSFHHMDDLLRETEHRRELLALKKALKGAKAIAAAGDGEASATAGAASSEAPSAASSAGEVAEGPKPGVIALLEQSIQQDLQAAKEKGSLTKEEANTVVLKMAALKRLQNQQGVAADVDADPATAADAVGCTAVCLVLTLTEVVCANAGDSRAVLCRRGVAVELSHDHKPNDPRERQRIQDGGGYVEEIPVGTRVQYRVNGNLNLSRALGDHEYKRKMEDGHEKQIICGTPDLITEQLTAEDEFIVVACDGVWDVKTNQEVCDFVGAALKRGDAIADICESLLDACITPDPKETHGLGGDNMTCIVVELKR